MDPNPLPLRWKNHFDFMSISLLYSSLIYHFLRSMDTSRIRDVSVSDTRRCPTTTPTQHLWLHWIVIFSNCYPCQRFGVRVMSDVCVFVYASYIHFSFTKIMVTFLPAKPLNLNLETHKQLCKVWSLNSSKGVSSNKDCQLS